MQFVKRNIYIPEYKYVSTNQHGDRYEKTGCKAVSGCRMTAQMDNKNDVQTIVILSDRLDVPITYDFQSSPQTASIEFIAKRNIP
jgi:hypothetical protein